MNTVFLALITGLTAGGISCMAVQGGLLTSALSGLPEESKVKGTASFVVSKFIAHTILGALLGFFGASLSISPKLQGWMQVFAGVYMLITAANLLNLHPVLRYAVIQPPKWAYKLLKKESHKQIFGPALLGFLTILVPCGITQGMMILAISSGSAFFGSLILGAFTLGTSPLFFITGIAASQLFKRKTFTFAVAIIISILGINSISTGNTLRGSPHTIANYWKVLTNQTEDNVAQTLAAADESGVQNVVVDVTSSGYQPHSNTLKVNVPVKLKLVSKGAAGCVQVFTIPSLGIRKLLPREGNDEINFTPSQRGILSYSCAMGMYTGQFQVI